MRFLDENRDVIKWGSENTVIPYVCPTDRRAHRYFVDFKVTFANGKTVYVEVKPKRETTPPKIPARKTKRFVTEVMTYAKNQAKWKAADRYAQERGASFEVWTEDTIRSLGIKLL